MDYLNRTLEPDDCYRNKYTKIKLPSDHLLDKPEELEKLSGPVSSYNLRDLDKEVK